MCAVCPECNEIITELFRKCSGIEESRFYLDGDCCNTEEESFESDGEVDMYFCPICNEELFNDWEEAEKFLKEKDELKEMIAKKIKEDKK